MVTFKELNIEDIDRFWNFLNALDRETSYMMYEPGEREQRTDIQELRTDIQSNVKSGRDFLQIAVDDHEIIGYIRAERGGFNRTAHTAYIVIGILRDHSGKGIGTAFFRHLDQWAEANGVIRLELTVECHNENARHLYEKSGFKIEGTRVRSMLVDGSFVDEYYMSKLL